MDYIAPEQIRMPDDVGPSADIYALGCTLYFAVTGQVPFPGGTRREKMQRHLSATPVPIAELAPHLSADFCRVIEAMMARNPAERIKSAGDVAERLRRWSPAVPPAMPRKGGAAKSERSAGEPPPLPDEQPHSLGWLTRWARQDTPQPRRRDDDVPWLLPEDRGADTVLAAEPMLPKLLGALRGPGLARLFQAVPQALLVAAVAGVIFGGAMAVVREIDRAQFDKLLSNVGPTRLGCWVFLFLFVVQLAAVPGRRRR
jgi:hypothetical protein